MQVVFEEEECRWCLRRKNAGGVSGGRMQVVFEEEECRWCLRRKNAGGV